MNVEKLIEKLRWMHKDDEVKVRVNQPGTTTFDVVNIDEVVLTDQGPRIEVTL